MISNRFLPAVRKALLGAAIVLGPAATAGLSHVPAANAQAVPQTNGPASVADLAEGLLEAVVNISTSQNIKGTEGENTVPMPKAPEG